MVVPESHSDLVKTILLVDDDLVFLNFTKLFLEREYKVVTKTDGDEAMAYLKEGHIIDLILIDMEMPRMNGRMVVRQLKSNPRYEKIPVIFITAVDSSILKNSFKKLGVVEYIVKPFKGEDLLSTIRMLLK